MIAERLRRIGAALSLAAVLFAGGCASTPGTLVSSTAPSKQGADAVRIVVLGDSLAMGTGASDPRHAFAFLLYLRALAEHPGSQVTNFAIGGANLGDVARLEVPRLRHVQADVVLLCAGGNDVVERTAAGRFARSARALTAGIERAAPGASLIVVGIPDVAISPLFSDRRVQTESLVRRDGALLRAAAAASRAPYVDLTAPAAQARRNPARFLSADEFHPSDVGHAAIASAVWPALKAAIARRGMAVRAAEAAPGRTTNG